MRHELINQFSEEQIDGVDAIVGKYRKIPGSLLIALEEAQKLCKFLPIDLQRYIAEKMNVSPSVVYGVTTFYSYFSAVPKGRKVIKVCTGTACYVKHSQEITTSLLQHLKVGKGEVTPDGEYSLEEVRCLGACGLAPVIMVGEDTFGLVDSENAVGIIEKEKSEDG